MSRYLYPLAIAYQAHARLTRERDDLIRYAERIQADERKKPDAT